ncbi:hypothetical protein FEM54_29450 [Pseudomonas edaphica]|uniref:KaiC-like domain-containing protein n=1 Tax=Pseudomonas edaphica TaxID=2006980 RepID=A0ABY2U1A8_9PSED|nr:hypothetical protein FEM54_29450 [Pseudomonas edaphica]
MVEKLKRLQSGIEGLDALLKGGLVAGASYIIQGRPGSGKTVPSCEQWRPGSGRHTAGRVTRPSFSVSFYSELFRRVQSGRRHSVCQRV